MGLDSFVHTANKELAMKMSTLYDNDDYFKGCCENRGMIGYWRKYSSLHNWFVQNIQDGKDDCGIYYIEYSDLEEFQKIVHKADRYLKLYDETENEEYLDKIDDIFPMTTGFFFNPTSLEEWIRVQLDFTVKWIDLLMDNIYTDNGYDCYYIDDVDKTWECQIRYSSSW